MGSLKTLWFTMPQILLVFNLLSLFTHGKKFNTINSKKKNDKNPNPNIILGYKNMLHWPDFHECHVFEIYDREGVKIDFMNQTV